MEGSGGADGPRERDEPVKGWRRVLLPRCERRGVRLFLLEGSWTFPPGRIAPMILFNNVFIKIEVGWRRREVDDNKG